MLDACIQNFFRVSTLYRVRGGRTARKFRKGYTVLRGNREMTEKYEYCSTVPRTFVQDCRPYSRALGTVGSVMIIGLSINKCSHSKIIQFDEREQDWLVQRFMLRRLQRVDVIQREPPFPLLTQDLLPGWEDSTSIKKGWNAILEICAFATSACCR